MSLHENHNQVHRKSSLKKILQGYELLGMVYFTFLVAASVMFYKQVVIGHYEIFGTFFILPFCFVLNDLIYQLYGRRLFLNIIFFSLINLVVFLLLTTFLLHLSPPPFWHYAGAFNYVIGNTLHLFVIFYLIYFVSIFLAMLFSIFLVHQFRSYIKFFLNFFSYCIGFIVLSASLIFLVFLKVYPVFFLLHLLLSGILVTIPLLFLLFLMTSWITYLYFRGDSYE